MAKNGNFEQIGSSLKERNDKEGYDDDRHNTSASPSDYQNFPEAMGH